MLCKCRGYITTSYRILAPVGSGNQETYHQRHGPGFRAGMVVVVMVVVVVVAWHGSSWPARMPSSDYGVPRSHFVHMLETFVT